MKTPYDRLTENLKYQDEMLSNILNDDTLYFRCIDIIRPEMFTGMRRLIFDAYISLVIEGLKPDMVSISKKGNIPLGDVVNIATSFTGISTDINYLLQELFEFMASDRLAKLAAFISTQVTAGTEFDTITDHISRELRKLELGTSSKVITMEAGVTDLYRVIHNNLKQKSITGCPVGMKIIDSHMGGLQPGDLIVLAGEISHGKTSLALSMAYNSAVYFGQRCGIISHEMTIAQVMARLSAYATGFGSKELLIAKLSGEQVKTFSSKISTLIKANIFIQDYIRRDLIDTVSATRLMVMQHQVRWIIIENAGNITVKGKHTDEERTAEISRTLKALAIELGITIILVSHLSREREGRKVQPELFRLRHSGQLEADADVVLFVYRAELHGFDTFPDNHDITTRARCKVYVAKGRNYGLAHSYMDFSETLTYFKDHDDSWPAISQITPNSSFEPSTISNNKPPF